MTSEEQRQFELGPEWRDLIDRFIEDEDFRSSYVVNPYETASQLFGRELYPDETRMLASARRDLSINQMITQFRAYRNLYREPRALLWP